MFIKGGKSQYEKWGTLWRLVAWCGATSGATRGDGRRYCECNIRLLYCLCNTVMVTIHSWLQQLAMWLFAAERPWRTFV